MFQGEVRVTTRNEKNVANDMHTLRAGQSVQIHGKAITSPTASTPVDDMKRFVRTLRPVEPLPGEVTTSARLVLWLKADAIQGVKDGESIGFWSDSSGNRNNFYHVTSEVPTFIAGSHSGLNAMPVVRFHGNECFRGVLDVDPHMPNVQSLSTPFTLFAVVKNSDGGPGLANRAFFGGGRQTMAFGIGRVQYEPANSFWAWAPGEMATYGQKDSLNVDWNIHSYTVSDLNPHHWTWYSNGKATGSVGLDTGKPRQYGESAYLGGSSEREEYWRGDIAELLIYDRALGAAELKKISDYLAEKYRVGPVRTALPGQPRSDRGVTTGKPSVKKPQ